MLRLFSSRLSTLERLTSQSCSLQLLSRTPSFDDHQHPLWQLTVNANASMAQRYALLTKKCEQRHRFNLQTSGIRIRI